MRLLLINVFQSTHCSCLLNDNNDGTFSIKGEYQPKKVRTARAIVVSQDLLDPTEPMVETRKGFRSVTDEAENRPKTEEIQGGGSIKTDVAKQVIISSDLNMATNIRAYREWPGEYRFPPSLI